LNFSPEQEDALALVEDWLDYNEQIFRLFGYAGTGKTTLAKYIGADHFAAFTGKAAHVLREKGCGDASTIHSLIYNPREKSMERLRRLEKQRVKGVTDHDLEMEITREIRNLEQPFFTLNLDSPLRESRLLVIDECSMVDTDMANDLLSFGCKVLVLGDPAQLPPVGGGGYFTNAEPDILLTEVHRQARTNPILDMATQIRQGKEWAHYDMVTYKVDPEEALAYDQIICGTNKMRRSINRRVRELLGFKDRLPMAGDKIVCLRNNHELGLMNGALFEAEQVEEIDIPKVIRIQLKEGPTVLAHTTPFLGDEPIDPWTRRSYNEFDFGYALTCHKSQGSQWDSVLVFDESHCFRKDARRWLYTAVTRAAKKLKVVV
jgi:exodeoxyribonuclease-5